MLCCYDAPPCRPPVYPLRLLGPSHSVATGQVVRFSLAGRCCCKRVLKERRTGSFASRRSPPVSFRSRRCCGSDSRPPGACGSGPAAGPGPLLLADAPCERCRNRVLL